jgi:hypothetical protein
MNDEQFERLMNKMDSQHLWKLAVLGMILGILIGNTFFP